MTICMIFQMYLAMYQVHAAVPSDAQKLADGAKWLQNKCLVEQEKAEKTKMSDIGLKGEKEK